MKLRYFLALALCLFCTPAKAELQIDVNGAMRDPLPIAFPEMIHEGFFLGQTGNKIRDVVIADLERSELYPNADLYQRTTKLRRLESY